MLGLLLALAALGQGSSIELAALGTWFFLFTFTLFFLKYGELLVEICLLVWTGI